MRSPARVYVSGCILIMCGWGHRVCSGRCSHVDACRDFACVCWGGGAPWGGQRRGQIKPSPPAPLTLKLVRVSPCPVPRPPASAGFESRLCPWGQLPNLSEPGSLLQSEIRADGWARVHPRRCSQCRSADGQGLWLDHVNNQTIAGSFWKLNTSALQPSGPMMLVAAVFTIVPTVYRGAGG